MDIWDLLKKKGLGNNYVIEEKIMHDWSVTNILDLNEEINSLIKPIDLIMATEFPTYQFVANAELSGQIYGGCRGVDCRTQRVEELTRFASLWADKVYVPSYFDKHIISSLAKESSESRTRELEFRLDYLGNIKCLIKLKPLLEAGIVELVRGEAQLCPICMADKIEQCDEIRGLLYKQVEEMSNEYRDLINATVRRDKKMEKLGIYNIDIKAPEDIYHHKSFTRRLHTLPKWLEKRYTSSTTYLNLGKKEMKLLDIPEAEIYAKAQSVLFLQIMATLQGLNSSLWTNSHLEVKLLNSVTGINENVSINEVLLRELACELPVIFNVPLKSLLEIREKEHEAFLVYRDSIREVTSECISKGMNIRDARQLYQDVIIPKLNSLNLQVKEIKDRAWRNLKIEIGVLVTCGVFGLLSDTLAIQIPLLTASGVTLRDMAKKFRAAVGTPSEIRRNDVYFLWKASKKAMKRR